MTAVDHETGEDIINPFISVEGEGRKGRSLGSVFMNTSTFGPLQGDLTHSFEWMGLNKNPDEGYAVWATVGEYNSTPNLGQVSSNFLYSVSITRKPRAKIFLGYLERELVEEKFPETKKFFDKQRENYDVSPEGVD